jgi:hypothetical protein
MLNKRLPARKLIAAVFWGRKGMLTVEFMHQGITIKSELYCGTLKDYVGTFKKSRGMLTSSVVLLHDNARPHTSTAAGTRALLEHFNWELFDHLSYSRDLAEELAAIAALQK